MFEPLKTEARHHEARVQQDEIKKAIESAFTPGKAAIIPSADGSSALVMYIDKTRVAAAATTLSKKYTCESLQQGMMRVKRKEVAN